MIHKIHHISAIAKSAPDTIYFYTKILGLRLVKNTVNQENTKMRHLFFGDYLGSPGSLLTFFEIQKVGHRQDKRAYFSTVYLAIPKGSFNFWKQRLTDFEIDFHEEKQRLYFQDTDAFKLALVETDHPITEELATRHTTIPQDKQIVHVLGTTIVSHLPDETANFLTDFLDLAPTTKDFRDSIRHDWTTVETSSQETNKSRIGRGTIDHVAYSVKNAAELETYYQKAKAMQLPIEEYVDRGYFKSLYIREPSGLRIEIATEEPGFLLDETAEQLGETLALPEFLETQRTQIEKQLEENVL